MGSRDITIRITSSEDIDPPDAACVLVTLTGVRASTYGFRVAEAVEIGARDGRTVEMIDDETPDGTWSARVVRGADLSQELFEVLLRNCVNLLRHRGVPGTSITHALTDPEAATKWRAGAMRWFAKTEQASEADLGEALRLRIGARANAERSQDEALEELAKLPWGDIDGEWLAVKSALGLGLRAGRQWARWFDRYFDETDIDEFSAEFDVRTGAPDMLTRDVRLGQLARLLESIAGLLGVTEKASLSEWSSPGLAVELAIDAFG